jgi:glycerol-3-phosphate cytidylyltransferase
MSNSAGRTIEWGAARVATREAEGGSEPSRTEPRRQVRVATFGTFDLFHIGHLNMLRRARALGDYLVVGVSSDELNTGKKGRPPVVRLAERLAIVHAVRYVDEVFVEESLDLKADYLRRVRADVLVMGDDWAGRFDHFSSVCRVVYLPRTPEVSTTSLLTVIRSAA